MRNTILKLVLLLGASSVTAVSASENFQGMYATGSVGISRTSGKFNLNPNVTFGDAFIGNSYTQMIQSSPRVSSTKPGFALGIGYGQVLGSGYLGGEFGLFYTNAFISRSENTTMHHTGAVGTSSTFDSTLSINLKEKQSVGITFDLVPGFTLREGILFFGRLGVMLNKNKLESITNWAYVDNNGVTNNAMISTKTNKTRAGLRAGIGMTSALANNLALNLNYIFTYFPQKISTSGSANVSAIAAGIAVSNGLQSSPSIRKKQLHTMMLGLTYYFGN